MSIMMEERYFTLKEIAEVYKISEETIRRYIRQGKLEAVYLGGMYRVSETAWKEFLNSRKGKK